MIGQVALDNLQAARTEILAGDRESGGQVSAQLRQWTTDYPPIDMSAVPVMVNNAIIGLAADSDAEDLLDLFIDKSADSDAEDLLDLLSEEAADSDAEDLLNLFRLIDDGNLTQAKELQISLKEEIGFDEPEFARADVLIHRKEVLGR